MSIVNDDAFQKALALMDYVNVLHDVEQNHRISYVCDEIEKLLDISKQMTATRKIPMA